MYYCFLSIASAVFCVLILANCIVLCPVYLFLQIADALILIMIPMSSLQMKKIFLSFALLPPACCLLQIL